MLKHNTAINSPPDKLYAYTLPVVMISKSTAGLGQVRPCPLTLTLYLSPQCRELMLQAEPLVVQVGLSVMSMALALAE